MITQQRLKEVVIYNPITGGFVWKVNLSRRQRKGCELKRLLHGGNKKIYYMSSIDKRHYLLHRLAWLYVYGEFPVNQIDHIDGNGLNNKIDNLRDVTNKENSMNKTLYTRNKSGVNGVFYCKATKKWKSTIMVDGKSKHLGRFEVKDDAIIAREKANIKYGFHENHGRKA